MTSMPVDYRNCKYFQLSAEFRLTAQFIIDNKHRQQQQKQEYSYPQPMISSQSHQNIIINQPMHEDSSSQNFSDSQSGPQGQQKQESEHRRVPSFSHSSYTQSAGEVQIIEPQYTINVRIQRNTFVFGILLLVTQFVLALVYAFVLKTPSLNRVQVSYPLSPTDYPGFSAIMMTIFVALIAIVGFGFFFAYIKKLIWSSIFFNLCICCLSIELYFIFNNLINRIGIVPQLQSYSSFGYLYLWNFQTHSTTPNQSIVLVKDLILPYGNTLITAFKCAIANSIAFSSLLGKTGLLQLYIVVFIGTLVFELSRQVLDSLGEDYCEAQSTFTFGGFYGLTIALIQYIRYRRPQNETRQNRLYTGSLLSVGFSFIGCVMLMALFPVFAMHPSLTQRSYLSRYLTMMSTTVYFAIGASCTMAIAVSFFINGKLNIRDLINGPISGAIAVISPAFFIVNPTYGLIVGCTAGTVQGLVQNFIQKTVARKYNIITTHSFCLFGVQGIIGAIFGTIFRTVMLQNNQRIPFQRAGMQALTEPVLLGVVAAALGIGAGLLAGFIVYFLSFHRREDHFHDRAYCSDGEEEPFLNEAEYQTFRRNRVFAFAPGLIPFI